MIKASYLLQYLKQSLILPLQFILTYSDSWKTKCSILWCRSDLLLHYYGDAVWGCILLQDTSHEYTSLNIILSICFSEICL